MNRRLPSVLLLALLFLASCNGDDRQRATEAAPSPATTPAPTPCAVEDGSMQARESEGQAPPVPLVTDVRYKKDGCPRIVFEFRDQESGYKIEYASPPFSECGSGNEVSTATWEASAFLVAGLEPAASADQEREGAPPTYDGPRDIPVRGRVLKHLKVICDFEAQFTWLIGLDRRHDFGVFTLDDPSRIVVDISES